MKLKAIILGIIAAALLFACYPLVSPIQPRTNLNDENSILPVATGFTATYNSTDPRVELSWTPIEVTGEQRRDGYLVIRKVGSAPVNVLDGTFTPAGRFEPSDNGSGYSDFIDDGSDGDYDEGIPGGYVYYYGLFAYYTDEEDPPSVTNVDENGNLKDTDYYIFAGPMVASVSVPENRTIQLPIAEEKTVWSATWEDNRLLTAKDSGDILDAVAIITFDTTDIQGVPIIDASLTLTNSNTLAYDYPNSFHLDSLTLDWNGNESLAVMTDITSMTIDMDNRITFGPSDLQSGSTTTVQNTELTNIVQDWADGLDRYGLRIMVDSMAAPAMNFEWEINNSGDGVSSQPILSVTYTYYPE